MTDPTTPMRRYTIVTACVMAAYVALNVAAIFGALDGLAPAARVGFAMLVALPIAAQIWITLVTMRDSDEFVRALLARRFIIAAGAAFALFSAWGFAESYAEAPHAPGWMIYPLFWALYGFVAPFVRSTKL